MLLGHLSSRPSDSFIPGLSAEAAQEGGKESHPRAGWGGVLGRAAQVQKPQKQRTGWEGDTEVTP